MWCERWQAPSTFHLTATLNTPERTANLYSLQPLCERGEAGGADTVLISGIIWPQENEGFIPRGEAEEPMNRAEGDNAKHPNTEVAKNHTFFTQEVQILLDVREVSTRLDVFCYVIRLLHCFHFVMSFTSFFLLRLAACFMLFSSCYLLLCLHLFCLVMPDNTLLQRFCLMS